MFITKLQFEGGAFVSTLILLKGESRDIVFFCITHKTTPLYPNVCQGALLSVSFVDNAEEREPRSSLFAFEFDTMPLNIT